MAKHGRSAFYEGEIADDMIAALQAGGGTHTAEDFAAVACEAVEPISETYKTMEVVEHPPNGHGATALLLDNMAPPDLLKAVEMTAGRAALEASGRVTAETVRAVAETGVDFISSGWITHSAPVLDFGLDFVSPA